MADLAGSSKLVSGKAYRLTIEGAVPIELAESEPDMIAAAIIQAFHVNLGVIGTVTDFRCQLLQQIPPQSQGQ